jgi:hypothetical protein
MNTVIRRSVGRMVSASPAMSGVERKALLAMADDRSSAVVGEEIGLDRRVKLLARMSRVVDAEWLRVEAIGVGRVPAGVGTPECYVTVVEDDKPVLRVDVYAYGPDSFAFQDAILWRDNLIVGFGSHVHGISLADRSAITISLGSNFGHAYPTRDYLIVASGERLFRMEPDRSVLWKSERLGIDGVVVHEPGPTVVRGEGEWNPPGGWRSFALFAADGRPATH